MLDGVRPGLYSNYHKHCQIYVDEDMVTHWKESADGKQTYLLPKEDYDQICRAIEELVG